jgi:predicted nucleotidyltransferase
MLRAANGSCLQQLRLPVAAEFIGTGQNDFTRPMTDGIIAGGSARGRDAVEFAGDVGLVLERLREALLQRRDLAGIYLYGSLVTGDFSLARSDIDVVVMLDREPDAAATRELAELHAGVAALGGAAGQLHCLYVAAEHAADPDRLCAYWFGDRMTQWQMKVMTQAELASVGVALHGPWPPPGIGPIPVSDIQAAVLAEMRGYWRRFARKRMRWLNDDTVDHALVVLPRAEAVLARGALITKGEAIGRLGDFGVPAALAQEIRDRRAGREVTLSPGRRLRRGYRARRIMQRSVRRLSQSPGATGM